MEEQNALEYKVLPIVRFLLEAYWKEEVDVEVEVLLLVSSVEVGPELLVEQQVDQAVLQKAQHGLQELELVQQEQGRVEGK